MKERSNLVPYKDGFAEKVVTTDNWGTEREAIICTQCGDPSPDYRCPRCATYVCSDRCTVFKEGEKDANGNVAGGEHICAECAEAANEEGL